MTAIVKIEKQNALLYSQSKLDRRAGNSRVCWFICSSVFLFFCYHSVGCQLLILSPSFGGLLVALLRKKMLWNQKNKLLLVYSMQFPLLTLSMELPDDSDLDVLILHQLDFILHVAEVSFSFDNIFLVKSKTSPFTQRYWIRFGLFLFWFPFSTFE